MAKFSLLAAFLMAWAQLISHSMQAPTNTIEAPYEFDNGFQVVYQGDGKDLPKSIEEWYKQIKNTELAILQASLPGLVARGRFKDTRALVTDGGVGEIIINREGTWDRHLFVEGLVPTHHRTEGRPDHWKDVLSINVWGTVLSVRHGEPAPLHKDLTYAVLQGARDSCDVWLQQHDAYGDCIGAEAVAVEDL